MTTSAPGAVDLAQPQSIHIIGLGGAGMSAIAEVLVGTGHRVSGSDLRGSDVLTRLADRGVVTHVGHDAGQLGPVDLVAISTAIPASNPELSAARERGIPVLSRAQILTAITRSRRSIAVAGTHGKTTTSAMLTQAMQGSGLDPAFIVGGDLRDLGRGAAVGSGEFLVVEADESDGTFVELAAEAVIVTNVEPDHLEHYGGFDGLLAAFDRFLVQAPGPKVVCSDDPGAAELVARVRDQVDATTVVTYGLASGSDWQITEPQPTTRGIAITLVGRVGSDRNPERHQIRLRQPGMHNARNAAAAFAMAVALGADPASAARALSDFGGVGRRFEERGEVDGIRLVDDYAHLPTEVAAALAAARSLEPGRLIAVFQPHRFSRTEQLHRSFSDAFGAADVLLVSGIYSANEAPRPGVTGRLVLDAVLGHDPDMAAEYHETLAEVEERLVAMARPGDLILTLGAGDLTGLPDRLVERLRAR